MHEILSFSTCSPITSSPFIPHLCNRCSSNLTSQPSGSISRVFVPSQITSSLDSNSSSSTSPYSLWKNVRVAVPLSKVFADHLGEDALHQLSSSKFKIVCPFHNDKNPSLHIDDDIGLFHCFACSAKGSVIDFQQLIDGHRSVSMALRSLGSKYPPIASVLHNSSFQFNSNSSSQQLEKVSNNITDLNDNKRIKISRRVYLTQQAIVKDVLIHALRFYVHAFWDNSTPQALAYLRNERGLSTPTLRAFSCGFAPTHPQRTFILQNMKNSHDFDSDDVVLAGLARKMSNKYDETPNQDEDKKNVRYYDIFHSRIVFPIRNTDGNIVSYASRTLPVKTANSKVPKYINGPDSPVFTKRNILFGADLASTASSATVEEGFVIVVEGYLDVMTIFDKTQGRVACVSSMGTSISVNQLQQAYKLLEDAIDGKVIINFDSDDAGIKSVERLCDNVFSQLTDCAFAFYIAFPPDPAKDADEFISKGGKADEYIDILLSNAKPWYQWRGDRIVFDECERLQKVAEEERNQKQSEKTNVNSNSNNSPSSMVKRKNSLQKRGPNFENETGDSGDFEIMLSEFMKNQSDDFAIAFGAKPEDVKRYEEMKIPTCSPKVLEQLSDIVAEASRCLPSLNIPALVHSWADALSFSTISVMLPLFRKLMSMIEKRTREWKHVSMQDQVNWLPPAPWLLADLPKWKRKSLGYGLQSDFLDDTDNNMDFSLPDSSDNISSNSGGGFLSDSRYMKRTLARLKAQEEHVIPFLESNQSVQVNRMKEAPRRCAEEIILRTLIFSDEVSRLDALQALIDTIIRCGEKNMAFWTCSRREELFEYLVNIDGPIGYEEMAAYLEEYEWFTEEIEELFLPLEDEADQEWKQIRMLEMQNPVEMIRNTAEALEKMAEIVASRRALDQSEDILNEIMDKRNALLESEVDNENADEEDIKKKLDSEVQDLEKQQAKLTGDIDRTNFLKPDEIQERKEEMKQNTLAAKLKQHQEEFWKQVSRGDDFSPEEWMFEGIEEGDKGAPS